MKYLDRIDWELANASAVSDRGVLLARKAAYLARIGRASEAKALVTSLRGNDQIYSVPRIPIWLGVVDGLIAFFSGLEEEARSKWVRAKALARACDCDDGYGLASAWLAHYSFSRFDFDGVGSELRAAFETVSSANADCLARACLVLAESAHLAGDRASANQWYSRSRRQAQTIGDEATVASIIFNTAAMQLVIYRQMQLARPQSAQAPGYAVLEAQSAESFERLIGVASLPELTPALKAQAHSLVGETLEAARIYDEILIEGPSEAQARNRSWLLSDWAYCSMRNGRHDRARELIERANASITPQVQIDDLASTYSRSAYVYSALGEFAASEEYQRLAAACWAEFAGLQQRVRALVGDFERVGLDRIC